MPYRFVDGFRAVPSWSCSKAVYKPVWHIPLLSVQWINSWRWAEKLSKTCRVSVRSKYGKLVHPFGSIIKKFVTMHGHTNVKNVVRVHVTGTYRGNRCIAPPILSLGTRWRWVVKFTPPAALTWERNPVPIEYEVGWAQEIFLEDKNLLPLSGIDHWSVQHIKLLLH